MVIRPGRWINYLRRAGFASYGKIRDTRQMCRAIATVHDSSQQPIHRMRYCRSYRAAYYLRSVDHHFMAVAVVSRLDHIGPHHQAAIGDRAVSGYELQCSYCQALAKTVIG